MSNSTTIEVYTDGSCHTQLLAGGWAALLFVQEEKTVLTGKETNTTHNRMELTAVIKALEYIQANYNEATGIHIFSDSQYVTGLPARTEKFMAAAFTTKAGKDIRNTDLVKQFLSLCALLPVTFTKIKAHQKAGETVNHNIEADKLSRKMVRDAVI